jgi:hypothetical protein
VRTSSSCWSGSITSGGVRLGSGSHLTITEYHAPAIQREVSSVQVAVPTMRRGVQVIFGAANWSTALQGETPEFFQAREWDVASGRLLTPGRRGRAAKVVVLRQTAAEHLLVGGARADGPGQESAVSWWPGWPTLVGSYELSPSVFASSMGS